MKAADKLMTDNFFNRQAIIEGTNGKVDLVHIL